MKKKIYIVLSLVTIVSLATSSCKKTESDEFIKWEHCGKYGEIDSFKVQKNKIEEFPFEVNETIEFNVYLKTYNNDGSYNLNTLGTSYITSTKKVSDSKVVIINEHCMKKRIFDTLKYFYSNIFTQNLQLCLFTNINEKSNTIANQRVFKLNNERLYFYESNHQNHYFNNKIYPISGNEIVFFANKSILIKLQNDNLELNEENLKGQSYCVYKKDNDGYKIEQIAIKDSLVLIKQ